MANKLKNLRTLFSVQVIVLLLLLSNISFSQTTINGRIVFQNDDAPAGYANIELNSHTASAMADKAGNFKLHVPAAQIKDTMVISLVGYESIHVPVSVALKNSQFKLKEKVKSMQTVTVFNTHQTVGIMKESIGYYRSWNYNSTGGEIGRIFKLPSKLYKLDKVRFKVANLCDTCVLQLHIRNVVNGKPGEKIINDSITVQINKLTMADKIPEFDLTAYDYTFKDDELFVSIEVLGCSSGQAKSCSFSFAGTDEGNYTYKSKESNDWVLNEGYAIYLKLFFRY